MPRTNREETWCAVAYGAAKSNCPNSHQQPSPIAELWQLVLDHALPRGSDSSGHSSVGGSVLPQDKTCAIMFSDALTNRSLKSHQLFLQ